MKNGGTMDDGVLIKILEWAWVSLFAMVAWLMKKVSVHDTGIQLLVQSQKRTEQIRVEEKEQHIAERREIIDAINANHKTVMRRLDGFEK